MFRLLCPLVVALSFWSYPAAAFFSFEMPRLVFPTDQSGDAQVTRGAGPLVTASPTGQ